MQRRKSGAPPLPSALKAFLMLLCLDTSDRIAHKARIVHAANVSTSHRLQYFADGYYPGGRKGFSPKFEPSAALVKATLLASADGLQQAVELDGSAVMVSQIRLDEGGCVRN